MPKAALHTIGCRLNQAETAIIANDLKKRGFEVVSFGEEADLMVINTCTVTEKADAKCRNAVRKGIRKNPDTFVAVVGCYSQVGADVIREIDGVDLIVGNEHKMNFYDFLDEDLKKNSEPKVIHSKISRNDFVIDSSGEFDSHTRANIKIQDGCSFACSFCLIVKARGPARSRDFDDLLKEAGQLVKKGFKEIVLTGVNNGTYQQNGRNFLDILRELENLDGLERIRISSIEPTTISKELIDYMAASKKVCRYLHVPLQSGDDQILESMRRKHTAADFKEIIEYAAEKIPGIGIGTDVMVGYPGETEEQFKNSKWLAADLPLSYFHVFTYSDRKGTSAHKLKPKVSPEEKKRRNRIMIETGQRKKKAFADSFLGEEVNVLFEEINIGYWEGWTDNYIRVAVKSERDLKNQIKAVHLKSADGDLMFGLLKNND